MGDLYKCKNCGQLLYGISEPVEVDGNQAEEILKTIDQNGFYIAPEPVPFLESDFLEFLEITDSEEYGTRYAAGPTFQYVLKNLTVDDVVIGTRSMTEGGEYMTCPICNSQNMYHTLGLVPTTVVDGVWGNYIESDHTWYILSDSLAGNGSITELEKRNLNKYISSENNEEASIQFEQIIKECRTVIAAEENSFVNPDDIDLTTFFNNLMTVKVGIWLLENRLFDLIVYQMDADRCSVKVTSLTKKDLFDQIINRKTELEKQIADTENSLVFQIRPDWEEKYNCRKPASPEQAAVPTEPEEPEYKKAGLLNRDKTTKENDRLRQEYMEKKKQYDKLLQEYNEVKEKYENEIAHYEKRKNEIFNTEEVLWKSSDIYKENVNRLDTLRKEMGEVTRAENNFSAIVEKLTADAPVKQLDLLIKEEAAKNIKMLKRAYTLEAQLQALVFVLPKYLDVIAVAKIYEYLKSGRCTQLNGANGAYRIYDNEIRINHSSRGNKDSMAIQMNFQREYTIYSLMSAVSSAYSDVTEKSEQLVNTVIHEGKLIETEPYKESMEVYYSLAEEKLKTGDDFLEEHKKK